MFIANYIWLRYFSFQFVKDDLCWNQKLKPLKRLKASFSFAFRFKIGLGSSVDLDLSEYGKCHYISTKHATLFFDQFTRVYELMNYSEHGTVVDNLIYSSDLTLHPLPAKSSFDEKCRKMAPNSKKCEEFSCFCNSSPAELNMEKGECNSLTKIT